MLEKQSRAVRVTGYIQDEKLVIWKNVKKELEIKNGQKLTDSFILNFILSSIQKENKLLS
jgi:hypothetical protein